MTTAVDGLAADRAALLELCGELGDGEWRAESGCPGWSVQDVVSHMGALFWMVVDPSKLPDTGDVPTELAQERLVASRRSMSAEEVVDDYAWVSRAALEVLAGLEGADAELPLGDLGTYPASLVPTAFSFDHFVHIRADLFAPRGPLTGPAPESDELRIGPTLEWIEAALPQQNVEAVAALTGSVEFVLDGPGARTIGVGTGPTQCRVKTGADAFVRCITQRSDWDRADIEVVGDGPGRAALRGLHVF
jgi:uncharacterized protein (TIGR03083 family)